MEKCGVLSHLLSNVEASMEIFRPYAVINACSVRNLFNEREAAHSEMEERHAVERQHLEWFWQLLTEMEGKSCTIL